MSPSQPTDPELRPSEPRQDSGQVSVIRAVLPDNNVPTKVLLHQTIMLKIELLLRIMIKLIMMKVMQLGHLPGPGQSTPGDIVSLCTALITDTLQILMNLVLDLLAEAY